MARAGRKPTIGRLVLMQAQFHRTVADLSRATGASPDTVRKVLRRVKEIKFVIPGAAVGKGRPRFARRGNFVSTYTDEKTASFENLVKLAAQNAMGDQHPFERPVGAEIFIFVTPPASWSQKKQRAALAGEIRPTSKPDLDNCAKAIFDACNEIVFPDDKQVVEVLARKSYAAKAETLVLFREVA